MKTKFAWLAAAVVLLAGFGWAQGDDLVAQGAVINNLAKIYAANLRYQDLYKKKACDLGTLGAPAAGKAASAERAGLLEAALVSGTVGDYRYVLTCSGDETTPPRQLTLLAKPSTAGHPYFCTDRDGSILRASDKADPVACHFSNPVDIYQVAMVNEYCALATNGLMERAKCVANAANALMPQLTKSSIAANEASALGNLRTINTAEVTYSADKGNFAPDLKALATAGLIDEVLGCANASCDKSGYKFTLLGKVDNYLAKAIPSELGSTGQRSFCSDASAVLRVDAKGGDIADEEACGKLPTVQ